MGWTSDFPEITETSSAHCISEMTCNRNIDDRVKVIMRI